MEAQSVRKCNTSRLGVPRVSFLGRDKKITEETADLRKCYDNTQKIKEMSERKLATIFLLDGCFLLDFIYYLPEEYGVTYLDLTIGEITNMKQDLFLLENQLPFKVLILLLRGAPHLLYMTQIKIGHFVASQAPVSRGIWDLEVDPWECFHLLDYLSATLSQKHTGSRKEHGKDGRRNEKPGTNYGSCRTVQELMAVGISFESSSSRNLTSVSYEPGCFGTTARLELPTINISTSTVITYLNLIAFESSLDTSYICDSRTLGVISYLCFMDSLIDCEDDVKRLQVAGILRNYVGEPKDVAQFFNTVCSDLVPHPSAYSKEIQDIERHAARHYKSRIRKWYVQCKQNYFSSPWSCIALFAAIIGLSLTAIQAFTSVYPKSSPQF